MRQSDIPVKAQRRKVPWDSLSSGSQCFSCHHCRYKNPDPDVQPRKVRGYGSPRSGAIFFLHSTILSKSWRFPGAGIGRAHGGRGPRIADHCGPGWPGVRRLQRRRRAGTRPQSARQATGDLVLFAPQQEVMLVLAITRLIDVDQAFAILRDEARNRNQRLSDLARALIAAPTDADQAVQRVPSPRLGVRRSPLLLLPQGRVHRGSPQCGESARWAGR